MRGRGGEGKRREEGGEGRRAARQTDERNVFLVLLAAHSARSALYVASSGGRDAFRISSRSSKARGVAASPPGADAARAHLRYDT